MKLRQIRYLKPDVILNHLHDLDANELKKKGISYLVFDVDDTLTLHNDNHIDPETVAHIKKLTDGPIKQIFIASNSRRDLNSVAEKIDATVIRSTILSRKPLARHYRKILKEIDKPAGQIAMIGDRLSTDILGGNLAGMTTILVTPLGMIQTEIQQVLPSRRQQSGPGDSGENYFTDLRKWLSKFFDRSRSTGMKRTVWFLVAAVGLGLFGFLTHSVTDQAAVLAIDADVRRLVLEHRAPWLTNIFTYITALAGTIATTLLVVVWALLSRMRPYRRLAFVIIIAAILQALVVFMIKLLIARDRPDNALALVTEATYSFPSGHTMAATVVWGSAAYMLTRTSTVPWIRVTIAALYTLAIGLVAVSRIYLGAHYFSDTLASIGLGLGLAALYLGLIVGHPSHLPKKYFARGLRWRLLTGMVITAALVLVWTDAFV